MDSSTMATQLRTNEQPASDRFLCLFASNDGNGKTNRTSVQSGQFYKPEFLYQRDRPDPECYAFIKGYN